MNTDAGNAAGLVLSSSDITIAILAFVVGVFLIALFIRKDTAKEQRRYNSMEVSSFCERYGLTITSEFFRAYSVGDYSGMIASIRTAITIIRDSEARKTLLRGMWLSITKEFFKEEDERAFVLKELTAQAKAYDVEVTVKLPVKVAKKV